MPSTIEEVLAALDQIIEQTIKENNYLGIFAYVYRRTTAGIQQAIRAGAFEDNPRMEVFDVHFANYYLKAFEQLQAGEATSRCWASAFEARNNQLANIQHLLLGMNAHINLDLALTAAEVMRGKDIQHIKNDFNKVNDILASLVNELQNSLARISPLFFLVDWLGKDRDEALINFSMTKARDQSWRTACLLWAAEDKTRQFQIDLADETVATIAKGIIHPPGRLLRWALRLVGRFEEKRVDQIVSRLRVAVH